MLEVVMHSLLQGWFLNLKCLIEETAHQSDISLVRQHVGPTLSSIGPTYQQSDTSIVRQLGSPTKPAGPTTRQSDISIVRQLDSPTTRQSDNSIVRQLDTHGQNPIFKYSPQFTRLGQEKVFSLNLRCQPFLTCL